MDYESLKLQLVTWKNEFKELGDGEVPEGYISFISRRLLETGIVTSHNVRVKFTDKYLNVEVVGQRGPFIAWKEVDGHSTGMSHFGDFHADDKDRLMAALDKLESG